MNDIILILLVSLGALFILLAAIGLVRMPDLYLRISVTTKAATLGVGLLLVGSALYFREVSTTTRAIAIIFFLLLTAPIGAHLLGRASYFIGVPMWKKSVMDDLIGKYDKNKHTLEGGTPTETDKTETSKKVQE
jgi:multicomponent Na+:H+ antiporter subunit G